MAQQKIIENDLYNTVELLAFLMTKDPPSFAVTRLMDFAHKHGLRLNELSVCGIAADNNKKIISISPINTPNALLPFQKKGHGISVSGESNAGPFALSNTNCDASKLPFVVSTVTLPKTSRGRFNNVKDAILGQVGRANNVSIGYLFANDVISLPDDGNGIHEEIGGQTSMPRWLNWHISYEQLRKMKEAHPMPVSGLSDYRDPRVVIGQFNGFDLTAPEPLDASGAPIKSFAAALEETIRRIAPAPVEPANDQKRPTEAFRCDRQ